MRSSVLDRARAGDDQAFRELTAPYVRELHLHCYRMLGSLAEADDLVQETLIAAWRGLGGFEERSSLRAWLHRIATNRCLNAVRDARRRAPAAPVPPFVPPDPTRRGEMTWLQPYPDTWLEQLPDPAPGPGATYEAHAGISNGRNSTNPTAVTVAMPRVASPPLPRYSARIAPRNAAGAAIFSAANRLGRAAMARTLRSTVHAEPPYAAPGRRSRRARRAGRAGSRPRW